VILQNGIEKGSYAHNMSLDSMSVFADSNDSLSRGITLKSVSVGAGAKIDQQVEKDRGELEQWNTKVQAVMRIYFVFEDEFNELVNHGIRGFDANKPNGMLDGIPVG